MPPRLPDHGDGEGSDVDHGDGEDDVDHGDGLDDRGGDDEDAGQKGSFT